MLKIWKKLWEQFWSYLLNSTANPANFHSNWAGLAELFKGQLISKCLFGVIVSTKIATKILLGFLPWFFLASLGLPGDLVSNIIDKEASRKPPKASRKPQRKYKNFQGRNPYNIFVAILVETMTPKRHFEINWPLASIPNNSHDFFHIFRIFL